MKTINKFIAVAPIMLISSAHAGGLYLYETSTTDIGLASAVWQLEPKIHRYRGQPSWPCQCRRTVFFGNFINLYGDATWIP